MALRNQKVINPSKEVEQLTAKFHLLQLQMRISMIHADKDHITAKELIQSVLPKLNPEEEKVWVEILVKKKYPNEKQDEYISYCTGVVNELYGITEYARSDKKKVDAYLSPHAKFDLGTKIKIL